ncbi:MAG: glycosyltransferase, partial [Deltaproteobacteria bacterium]
SWVLVSKAEDLLGIGRAMPKMPVSYLRRGINKEVFSPRHGNRRRLRANLGIPEHHLLLLFVGRIGQEKNVMLLAQIVRTLREQDEPIHLLVVGAGSHKEAVRKALGPAVTFTGSMPQSRLPWIYASADLFVFPSETEVYPNVVLEAKASGLPVLVSSKGGAAQLVKKTGLDGFVVGDGNPQPWVRLIKQLRLDSEHRKRVGVEARKDIDNGRPSWRDVLVSDLLPIWERVANGASSKSVSGEHGRSGVKG